MDGTVRTHLLVSVLDLSGDTTRDGSKKNNDIRSFVYFHADKHKTTALAGKPAEVQVFGIA